MGLVLALFNRLPQTGLIRVMMVRRPGREAPSGRLGGNGGTRVLDLKDRLRCHGCRRKGRAVGSIKWRQRG